MSQNNNDSGHIVYVLSRKGLELECSLRWTRLLKWDAFSEVDLSDLKSVFSKKYTSCVTPEDRSVVTSLMQLVSREGQWPVLDGEYGYEVFCKLIDTKRAFFHVGSNRRLAWGEDEQGDLQWRPALGVEGMWESEVELSSEGKVFPLVPPIYIDGVSNVCGHVLTAQPPLLLSRWAKARRMGESDVSNFCLRLAKEFPEASFPVPECARLEENQSVKPFALLTVQERSITDKRERTQAWVDLRDRLRLRLRFQYGRALVAWDDTAKTVSYRQDGVIQRVVRDHAWESEVISNVESWGFAAGEEGGDIDLFNFDSSTFCLRDGHSWRRVLESVFPALDTERWRLEFASGLEVFRSSEVKLYPTINDDGDGEYSVSLDLEFAGRCEPLLPLLQKALLSRAKSTLVDRLKWLGRESFAFCFLDTKNKATRLTVLDNDILVRFADELFELFDRKAFDSNARTRISRWRLGELASSGLIDETHTEGISAIKELRERIGTGVTVSEAKPPKNLNTSLRAYQKMGLGWLSALSNIGAGGILADDMGLGKTVQVIAHLLSLKRAGKLDRTALIVAPTSVVEGWMAEIKRFAPDLEVDLFHGSKRADIWGRVGELDVLLTTYGVLRVDAERLQSRRWSVAVLDEAQYIKNSSSRSAVAARGLRSTHRLCLTGTPIENRIEELWSLFEFALPGFLGSESVFRDRIARPLKDAEDSTLEQALRDRLKRRLSPFMLRRSKSEVLKDLPERTEVVHAISFTPTQREFYDSYRKSARAEIRTSMATSGIAGARMLILSRLLRLRQICCDPRLIEDGRRSMSPFESAKLQALRELVAELIEQGSRILIFSQFTSMLELIGEALRGDGIDFLELTGASKGRAELVSEFQSGEIPVFLISLRAGGVGLNLTAADCVIHYDPWWNPAVERQASDRVYRMGQDKPVFVYKLIVDDSIESRIQKLQQDKMELVQNLLTEGDIDRIEIDEKTVDYFFDE